ncbi:hypothetical protein F5Y02DRAFT_297316 [Annulohypoxylon stygium]|nr:hypothetical protein F5Y02DRAFT_297316 [Annulohypoxylon stygium]
MASAPVPSGGLVTTTLAICGLVIILAIIFVGLRFYVRAFTRAGFGYDDWFILLGVITTLIITVVLVGNTINPNGQKVTEVTDPNYHYTKSDTLCITYSFIAAVLYFTSVSTTKLGILFMYYRIFARSSTFRYQLFFSGGLVVCWWIIASIVSITHCSPVITSGAPDDPMYCRNFNIIWMAAGVCEIFIDTLILTLPVGVVLRMRLSPRRKLAISAIFMLGSFVIITGIVKVIQGYNPPSHSPSYSRTEIWATIHICMATICACLPIFRPLIHRVAKSSFVTKTSTILSIRSIRSIRRPIESRQSERRHIIDGNEHGESIALEDSRVQSGETVILQGPQGPLQQPNAAHLTSSTDQFDGLLLPQERPYDPRFQRRSRVETAESSMAAQLATYLEYGTDSSETVHSYSGRV